MVVAKKNIGRGPWMIVECSLLGGRNGPDEGCSEDCAVVCDFVIVDSVIVVLPLVDRWFAKKLQNVAHTRKILRASSEE
jgi:hypothetical protein